LAQAIWAQGPEQVAKVLWLRSLRPPSSWLAQAYISSMARVPVAPLSALCIAVVLQLGLVQGKLQAGTVTLGGADAEQRWRFLSKFGYQLGSGSYDVRLKLRPQPDEAAGEVATSIPEIDLEVFLDEDWPTAEALPACRRASHGPARKTVPALRIGRPGEWGPWQGGILVQSVRPHIWYFALSSCHGSAHEAPIEVDYEVRMRQYDDSELSAEMRPMLPASVTALFCLTAFAGHFCARCRRFRSNVGMVHPVILTLSAVIFAQWLAQAFHTIHLWIYRGDGVGEVTLDFISEVLFMLSQVVTSTLLILIAQGYTLLRSKMEDMELIRPIAIVVGIVHVVLVGLGKLQGDTSGKYHEHEGLVGWILLAIRILLYVWFASGVRDLRRKSGFRLHTFLQRFNFVGSVYFLAFPTIFTIVQVFAQYLQHPIMQVGLLTMQTASSFWLADLFLSRGEYYEVSDLSSSLLPGCCGGFSPTRCKKED